jgi:hypothetical protein
VGLRVTTNTMGRSLGRITAKFNKLPQEAHRYWKKITPYRTGNAKRRTRLQGSKIKANYNYAVPLDKGWSKQAPKGMSKPTENHIKKQIRFKILRK